MSKGVKRKYHDEYLNYGFYFLEEKGLEIPQCVLCLKTLCNGAMKPYQLKQHLKNLHPEHANKPRAFFESKVVRVKIEQQDASETFRQKESTAIVEASYMVALLIAKKKEEYSIGESLLKPCLLAFGRFLGNDALNKLQQISLSNDMIKTMISDMASNIKSKVVANIVASPIFAIQLDESTDVANLSQLLVFARYVKGPTIEEELLFCQPLSSSSNVEDVIKLVDSFFNEMGLKWENVVGVCTDGAPAMMGSQSDVMTQMKEKNPQILGTHCIINREALAMKTLPKCMCADLNNIIDVVKYMEGSAQNTRLFQQLCNDLDSPHQELLFHNLARWLPRGNTLERVMELKEEIVKFLDVQGKSDLLATFEAPGFHLHLAYLADIFEELNSLNRKLHGRESTIINQAQTINAFMARLQLWQRHILVGDCSPFHRLAEVLGDNSMDAELQQLIKEHLTSLEAEFKKYFAEINTEDDEAMQLARNPFLYDVDKITGDIKVQEEFLDLKYDSYAKDDFLMLSLPEFWAKMYLAYPKISLQALRVIIPFSSTYLCETGFSALLAIISNHCSMLTVEDDLRCALSTINPDISELAKQKQLKISHD